MSLQIDQYQLKHLLGRGAQADVWRAEDAEGQEVACKIFRTSRHRAAQVSAALLGEIEAITRTDHPHIVRLLDFNVLTDKCSAVSAGAFESGRHYAVFELGRHGTARQRCGRLSLLETIDTLLQILDGLAHAHARGIVHLDLKPSNILWFGGAEGIKIADFGLSKYSARLFDDDRPTSRGGTPPYMSPEQRRAGGPVGPWSDIFSLGRLAIALITGAHPVDADNGAAARVTACALSKKRRGSPEPASRLTDWIVRATETDPGARFLTAEQAAHPLRALRMRACAEVPLGQNLTSAYPPTLYSLETIASLKHPCSVSNSELMDRESLAAGRLNDEEHPNDAENPVEIPVSWKRPNLDVWQYMSVDVNANLVHMREPPLVGRDEERSQIWATLRRTASEARAIHLRLYGEAGAGKTRLANWLIERVREIDVAGAVQVQFDRGDDAMEAIHRALLTTWKNAPRTPSWPGPGEQEHHIRRVINQPCTGESTSIERRLEDIKIILEVLTRIRPVVVVLHDLRFEQKSIRELKALMRAVAKLPVLLLSTIDETAPSDRACQPEGAMQACVWLRVDRLSHQFWRPLVDAVLRLHPSVAENLATATQGLPAAVVRAITHLRDTTGLVRGPWGFEPRHPRLDICESVDVEQTVSEFELTYSRLSTQDQRALEIGAVLGSRFLVDEWRAACNAGGVLLQFNLIAELEQVGILKVQSGKLGRELEFVRPAIQHWLIKLASREDRLRSHHLLAASGIRSRGQPYPIERLAAHEFKAGSEVNAIKILTEAIHSCIRQNRQLSAEKLLRQHRDYLDQMGANESDPRRGWNRLISAGIAIVSGRRRWMMRELEDLEKLCKEHGWDAAIYLPVRFALASAGPRLEAVKRMNGLAHLSEVRENPGLLVVTLKTLAANLIYLGAYRRAERILLRAIRLVEGNKSMRNSLADSWVQLARCQRFALRLDVSHQSCLKAIQIGEQIGSSKVKSEALTVMSLLHWHRGEKDLALGRSDAAVSLDGLDESDALSRASRVRGMLLIRSGDPAAGVALLERWLNSAWGACDCFSVQRWEAIGALLLGSAELNHPLAWSSYLEEMKALCDDDAYLVSPDWLHDVTTAKRLASDHGWDDLVVRLETILDLYDAKLRRFWRNRRIRRLIGTLRQRPMGGWSSLPRDQF